MGVYYKNGKDYIGNGSFIPILDTNGPVAFSDDAIFENNMTNAIYIFTANFYSTAPRYHAAITNHYIFAHTKFFKFLSVL